MVVIILRIISKIRKRVNHPSYYICAQFLTELQTISDFAMINADLCAALPFSNPSFVMRKIAQTSIPFVRTKGLTDSIA